MGSLPSLKTQPSSTARAPWPRFGQAHRLVHEQFGDGEAVVDLGEVQVLEPDAGHAPGRAARTTRVAANAVGSRRSAGKKSLAWPKPASRTGAVAPPVGRWRARRRRRRRTRGSSRCGAADRRPSGSCPRPSGRTPRRGPCGAGRRGCPRRCGGSSPRWCRGRRRGSGAVAVALLVVLGDVGEEPGEAGGGGACRPCRSPRRAGRRPRRRPRRGSSSRRRSPGRSSPCRPAATWCPAGRRPSRRRRRSPPGWRARWPGRRRPAAPARTGSPAASCRS